MAATTRCKAKVQVLPTTFRKNHSLNSAAGHIDAHMGNVTVFVDSLQMVGQAAEAFCPRPLKQEGVFAVYIPSRASTLSPEQQLVKRVGGWDSDHGQAAYLEPRGM